MPSFSFLLTLAVIALHTTLASARPIDNSGNAYGGKGGYASGGNVTHPEKDKNLLSILGIPGIPPIANLRSGNAGHGGNADAGSALAVTGSNSGYLAGSGGSNSGNAYTKDGGVADGGSVQVTDALINIDSNNAGHGGAASSGAAVGSSGSGSKDDHGNERNGDHEDHQWDNDDHEDHDHEDDYQEDEYEDYEDYVDRKRHEHQPNDANCDCQKGL